MNIEDVNKIIDKIDKSSLSFFELDIENCHIKIDKSEVRSYAASGVVAAAENKVVQNYAPDMNIKSNANAGNSIANTTDAAAATVDEDDSVVVVKAPIVGTFYGAPSPDSDNFVSVGSKVKKGDTLCIIESMKLMNEIESEEDGEVVAIIANDKAMVEYGQPLFKIRRASIMLDVNEIKKIIPHRYPFLLLDKVTEVTEGVKAKGIKNVTVNEPFFQGHFPKEPVMPGVLIVEAMAQLGAVAILSKDEFKGKTAYFAGIDKVKFRDKVVPGDTLNLEVEIIKMRRNIGIGKAVATVNDKKVCEGELMFAIG